MIRKRFLKEGISSEGRPDSKYYAFDWDDNIMFMPTKIMVLSEDDEEVGMSTEDFAEYRLDIGKKPFSFKGKTIIGFAKEPFRFFRTEGDKRFLIDCMVAPIGPSWEDFVECINGGSIFAIITARGHNPNTLKEAVKNLIVANKNGINSNKLIENLKKYESIIKKNIKEEDENNIEVNFDGRELVNRYLERCLFAPVSFGEGSATNPEEGKIKALRDFISYCKTVANEIIHEPGKFMNDVKNEEIIPYIGFSDDDPRNIEKMKDFLEKEYEDKPVRVYLTKGGEKKEV